MEKKLTPEELAEQELANKILPLVNEIQELEFRRGNGITIQKNEYIGNRTAELREEISKLKMSENEVKMTCEYPNCTNTDGKDYIRNIEVKGWKGEPIFLCAEHSQGFNIK